MKMPLRFSLSLLFVVLVTLGCKSKPDVDELVAAADVTPRYLALGDAYVIGEGVSSRERYPKLVSQRLGLADPVIVARRGWTVRDLQTGIAEAGISSQNYALVTLQVGMNDAYLGVPAEEFRADFPQAFSTAVEFARGDASRVWVVSIPDYTVTPEGSRKDDPEAAARVDAFNTIAREHAEANGAGWVDVTDITRGNPQLVTHDGLHPSPAQYEMWAEEIAAAVGTVEP